jgi:hypothetical protein
VVAKPPSPLSADGNERRPLRQPAVVGASVNGVSGSATFAFDERRITLEREEDAGALRACGALRHAGNPIAG